jgi:hypothetical protein
LQRESANGGKHPFVVGKDSAQMLALLLGEPVAVFANDVAELGLHLLTLIGRKLEGGICLSAKISRSSQSRSSRKDSSGRDGSLLTEFTPGDALAASVVGRLGHGQEWSCILYPRVNRNLALFSGKRVIHTLY